jgi:hypothetical protein
MHHKHINVGGRLDNVETIGVVSIKVGKFEKFTIDENGH